MSADLMLIAAPDEEWLRIFFRLQKADFSTSDAEGYERDEEGYLVMGSERGLTFEEHRALRDQISGADNVWVGQVSWLKAWILGEEDDGTYVPGPVKAVAGIVGDGIVLTPGVAKAILAGMNQPNRSIYGKRRVERVPKVTYDEIVEARRRREFLLWSPTPIGNNRIVYRKTSGLQRRRVLKTWLDAHIGQTIVQESW